MKHFKGLMAAPFTPFDGKGRLNLDIVDDYVNKLAADGVTGIFVCGSNGEGPNMSSEERIELTEAFIKASAGKLRVFVHVGHSSIVESQRLARHAQEHGADAISSVSAFYFKPSSVESLVQSLAEIAAAAPQLPFYYYHIPHLTGVNMDISRLLDLGKKIIPTLQGVKYTAPTLWEYQLCLKRDDYDLLFGQDEMMLPALVTGATGFIGSTYNFAAPLYRQVMQHFEKGDLTLAREEMLFLIEMVRIIISAPPIIAQKTVMKRLGLDLGPCRLPLPNFTPTEEASLLRQLDEIRFFEKLTCL